MKAIALDKSIIPACDVNTLERFSELVEQTCGVEGIGAYKIGFSLALNYGLKKVVEAAQEHTDLPIIYDHQKAGTDIPELGEAFARTCAQAGVNAIILFPQAGPVTEEKWIQAAFEQGLGVIVGGEMTHASFLESAGGFLKDDAPKKIYETAASHGIRDFVVPGNKLDKLKYYKEFIESLVKEPIFYSPGFFSQGGDLSEAAKAAGSRWHAIVGRALYEAKDVRGTARELAKKLLNSF